MSQTLEIQLHHDEPFNRIAKDSLEPLPITMSAKIPRWEPKPSLWKPLRHPRYLEVSQEVDDYFLKHWNFADAKAAEKFLKADFSGFACLSLPLAKDDRIHFACRFNALLFLIDDVLEEMSLAEGAAYNEKLISILCGEVLPDRSVPAEYMLYDLWESMRAVDKPLADNMIGPTTVFMRFQTDRSRLEFKELGPYLDYRKVDIGKDVISSTMCFVMGIHLSVSELDALSPLETNCAKHLSVINDIYSWQKEVRAAKAGGNEGAAICSAVRVLGEEIKLDIEATKRVLWTMAREWELVHTRLHTDLVSSPHGCRQAVEDYIKGVEYQISGNEEWDKTTLRYRTTD
ncbi:hypothetical protein MMC07_000571 [Pseudocyphellaria aurata]|nr:hypothetical protein [Pseudocyphellaria aurata]